MLLHAPLKPCPGLHSNLPGVTAALNDSPGQVRLVSLHAGAHGDGDTLSLVVQHQPLWALATWDTSLEARITSGFTVAVPAV